MADYSSMAQLDGDDVRLVDSQGKKASRDVVQFVSMQDFTDKDPQLLAKEVMMYKVKHSFHPEHERAAL